MGFREVKVIKPEAARASGDPFKPGVTFLFISCYSSLVIFLRILEKPSLPGSKEKNMHGDRTHMLTEF